MATSLALSKDQQARHPPFAPLSPADAFAKLVGLTITAAPGQTIVVEGDPADHYYRIVSGTVRLYQSIADGRRQVIDFLSDGEVFGLTGLEHHALSVEAVSRVVVIRYPRRWIEPALNSDRAWRAACSSSPASNCGAPSARCSCSVARPLTSGSHPFCCVWPKTPRA